MCNEMLCCGSDAGYMVFQLFDEDFAEGGEDEPDVVPEGGAIYVLEVNGEFIRHYLLDIGAVGVF